MWTFTVAMTVLKSSTSQRSEGGHTIEWLTSLGPDQNNYLRLSYWICSILDCVQ